ncbi:MAG TPA: M20/M25/M40 family metallo-hydrolase [Candidatus Dojkabacteria bacterium]|nr:M20/M25/M40 family metallo-hydrolase [Candidatus Dojkabacteria bacterium]HNW23615.1 M20/M25/M40 family metallo-hydrolase [Candidatus Dojkabacteria bacterium]
MEIEKILTDLIEIPSITSDTKSCKKAIDYINNLVKKEDLKTKVFEKDGAYSLLIAKEIKNRYEVILNGHLDVVPASIKDFKPKVKIEKGKRRMYGRGTSDMKGPVTSILIAFLETVKEGLDKDMALLFTTDEETGGFKGMKNVVDRGLTADIVFIPDGGQDWSICTDEKGVFHIKFISKGISAHGSRVWLGDNAVIKLIKVYANLEKEFNKRWGKVTSKDNWKPTLNLGALNGGTTANKVPNEAEMLIDIRYPNPVTQKGLEEIVNSSIVKDVTWKAISTGAPLSTNIDNRYVKSWIKLISNPIFEKEPGASDGRFLAEKGINTLITKPISSEPHIDNEWVDLDDLILFKDTVKKWIRSI